MNKSKKFEFPLMYNNINDNDTSVIINFLKKKPRLTASKFNYIFEKKWSKWLGCKYSIFVNSGSSANFLTLAALNIINKNKKKKQIIVPTICWNSDIVAVIKNNFEPIFIDINLKNLSMNTDEIKKKINNKTLAILLCHIQGFNAIDEKLLKIIKQKKIYLIEDVCESHGAKYKNIKCGNFGLASNFSFYYAHHMTTIEGGMISTNNKKFYDLCYRLKGHGLVRESRIDKTKKFYKIKYKDLNEEFIFATEGYNFRNTEIGAVLGINQLKRLNKNIVLRNKNMEFFTKNINTKYFINEYDLEGMSNYAFPIILKKKSIKMRDKFEKYLKLNSIEFRRGNAGGGNQLRQPYLSKKYNFSPTNYEKTEHVHHFGYYIGNYPELSLNKLKKLIKVINSFKH